jgi:hypothetical protein
LTLTCEQPEPQNTISGKVEYITIVPNNHICYHNKLITAENNGYSAVLFFIVKRYSIYMLLINQRRVDEVLFANRQKKKFVSKGILILTVVSALISLVAVIYEYFLPLYLIRKYNLNANESSSIGIIGGADGPTAIFVTSKPSNPLGISAIFFLIAILGVACLFFIRRSKN